MAQIMPFKTQQHNVPIINYFLSVQKILFNIPDVFYG